MKEGTQEPLQEICQEESKEEFKQSSNSGSKLPHNLDTIIELFNKRALEIEQDSELQNASLHICSNVMIELINSDLSINSICKLMNICLYISSPNMVSGDATRYLNEQDCVLLNNTLSKIKYGDILSSSRSKYTDITGNFQENINRFINVVRQYQGEILQNPRLLVDSGIFSLTAASLIDSGLSLESILKINKFVWVYKSNDNSLADLKVSQIHVSKEDAQYMEQILAGVEVTDSRDL
ncbi:MAG: hypothetical protein EB127_31725 [Alphaproteobacteria bacterium]|nr:hypothetical protein [Alphaproteobacteria bacterium]